MSDLSSPDEASLYWNALHVEDNEDDAFIVQRAFKNAGVPCRFQRCKDGPTALAYFQGKGDFQDRGDHPLPHLLLLDLKIPLKSGIEVLRWLRDQPDFKNQIVIILTSSSEKRDIQEARALNVNAYLVKPSSLDGMVELARSIGSCWLNDRLAGPMPGSVQGN